MRRTYTPSSSFSHSLTAALVHTTSLLPSTPSVLSSPPLFTLRTNHSGSSSEAPGCTLDQQITFIPIWVVQLHVFRQLKVFLVEGSSEYVDSACNGFKHPQKMCPFYFVWGLLWCSTVVLATSSMDTKPTAACRDLFSWAYSVNIFI